MSRPARPVITDTIRARVRILDDIVSIMQEKARRPYTLEYEYALFMRGAFKNRAARPRRVETAMDDFDNAMLEYNCFVSDPPAERCWDNRRHA